MDRIELLGACGLPGRNRQKPAALTNEAVASNENQSRAQVNDLANEQEL